MKTIITAVGLLLSGMAIATTPSTPSAPASVNSGSFSVSYVINDPGAIFLLQEQEGSSGSWSTVHYPSGGTLTQTTTLQRTPGVYRYRAVKYVIPMNGQTEVYYSGIRQVNVLSSTPPVVDSAEDQQGYEFRTRTGDVDGDGLLDIYVERLTGDLDNGVVSEAILRRMPDGTFAKLMHNTAQLSAAKNWSISTASVSIGDVDFDSNADIVVSDVDNGSLPHLVLSSGEFYQRGAKAVVPLDDEKQQFFADLAGWMTDENHFDDAMNASVPGYNIQVILYAEICFNTWIGPYCYGDSIVLLDINISLADLGISGNFGGASQTSPDGISAQSAANVIASQVHNAASSELSQYGVADLRGTPQAQAIGEQRVNEEVPAVAQVTVGGAGQILRCVAFCGYDVFFNPDGSTRRVYWTDVWTPITMPGSGFDSANYSEEAYDVSLLLNDVATMGESAISVATWNEVFDKYSLVLNSTVATPEDLPIPRDDVDGRKKKVSWWSRLGLGLFGITMADAANDVVKSKRMIHHYTDAPGVAGILSSGEIRPNGPLVFFTYLVYPGDVAMDLLSLCNSSPIIGYFSVRQVAVNPGIITRVAPKVCPSGTVRPGGGWEQTAPAPVSALPIRYWPVTPATRL